jgi:ubiquinone/menaquinone biosynthesis C-methylase UbiE
MAQTDTDTFDRLASGYDRGMSLLEGRWLRSMRARMLPRAIGRVLEIGVGTGANLPFYPSSISISAVDESTDMLEVAERRAASLSRRVHLSQVDAEHLSFPSSHFDTVVASLVLCSVVNQPRALGELSRVIRRPGGFLLLLEHMRPENAPLSWLADILDIPWCAVNQRCHLNRRTQQAIEQSGFHVEQVETRLGGFLRLIVARSV